MTRANDQKQKDVCTCENKPCRHYPAVGSDVNGSATMNTYGLMAPANPTSAEIREVIASLRTLADTFPGIIHAANGSGLSGSPMNTMGAIDRACDMLQRHSIDVEEREHKTAQDRSHAMRATAYDLAFEEGIQSEKNRAKEARKGKARRPAKEGK